MNYIKKNKKFWNYNYISSNVESIVFRIKNRLLNKYIDFKKKNNFKVLDFGCGQGANLSYFKKIWKFDVYGVDIAPLMVKAARKSISNKNKIILIDEKVREDDDFFNQKFDIIIAIQSLYYLSNNHLSKRLISLNNMLKDDGHVFFTMMSTKSSYFKDSNKKVNQDGLTKHIVKEERFYQDKNRKEFQHYINFTRNVQHLKSKFRIFKPLEIGYYDCCYTFNESGHHYTFFGSKRKK